MNRYIIIQIFDHGYSNHFELSGDNLYLAIYNKLKLDPNYFGWDLSDLIINDYGIDLDVNETTVSFLRFSAYYIMCTMFESKIDGDSNPGYISFCITSDDIKHLKTPDDIFSTNCMTIGEMPKIIKCRMMNNVMLSEILTYIFIMKIQKLKHELKDCRYNKQHDFKMFAIEALQEHNIEVHVDYADAEFDGENIQNYFPSFDIKEFLDDILNIAY